MYNKKALTLLEIVISLSIIAIVFVGIGTAFGVVMNGLKKSNLELIATNLARGLMAEIMSKNFCDPTACDPSRLGTESGEVSNDKTTFDDVDDYKGYIEVNPLAPDNQLIDVGMPNVDFRRYADCGYADEIGGRMDIQGIPPTNYKLITVTVRPVISGTGTLLMSDLILQEVKAANAD